MPRSPPSTSFSQSGADASVRASSRKLPAKANPGAGLAIPDLRAQLHDMDTQALDLKLAGMTCAACAARIEKVLNRVEGVHADVNFANETAHVEFDQAKATTDALIEAVRNAGYDAAPAVDPFTQPDAEAKAERERYRRELRVFIVSAVLTAPFIVEMLTMAIGGHAERLACDGWFSLDCHRDCKYHGNAGRREPRPKTIKVPSHTSNVVETNR